MNINYTWQVLHEAVLSLVSNSSIEQRLNSAFVYGLNKLEKEDQPEDLIAEIFSVRSNLTELGNQSYEEGLNKLTEVQLKDLAEKIVGWYDTICRLKK